MSKPLTVNDIPVTHIKDPDSWIYDLRQEYKSLPRKMGTTVGGVMAHYIGDINLYLSAAYSRGVTTLSGLIEVIESMYAPLFEMEGGHVDPETLTYTYPEDPTFTPIVVCRRSLAKNELDAEVNVLIAVYPYSIVYIDVNGETFMARID